MSLRDVLYIRVEAPADMTADEFATMRDIATSAVVSSVGKLGVDVTSYATSEHARVSELSSIGSKRPPATEPQAREVCANTECGGRRGHTAHIGECRVRLNFAASAGTIMCGCTTQVAINGDALAAPTLEERVARLEQLQGFH